MSVVALPCDNERNWRRLMQLFSRISSCRDVYSLQALLTDVAAVTNRAGQTRRSEVSGLDIFFDQYALPEESRRFFASTLPFIAKLAAHLKQEVDEVVGIPVKSGEHDISLKRSVVACLLACGVLCAFPAGRGVGSLNFVKFYSSFNNLKLDRCQSQSAKFRCIIHYFERLRQRGLENICGHVIYSRRVLSSIPTLDWWTESALPLCTIEVIENAGVEDSGDETLQVDFAARHIGGGVLATGRVQEEIRFCINPELIASMLFMDPMESHEAIVIRGTERFSLYTGYGQTLKFAGDYQDDSRRDEAGDLMTSIVAIDAVNVNNLHSTSQYSTDVILRDLLKAYAGFLSPKPDLSSPITSRDSNATFHEITAYADRLVTTVMDSVRCTMGQSESSYLHQQTQSQSLSDFADLQVAAIMQSVKEVLDASSSTSSATGFSCPLIDGVITSAPEVPYIEQLRSSTGDMSVDQYADILVSEAMASGMREHATNESNQTLDEWATKFVEAILWQPTLHSKAACMDGPCGGWSPASCDVVSGGTGSTERYRAVATGNWGCGAFGGDPQLKSLIQWMAISAAGRPAMLYYPYNNKQVEQLQDVAKHVTCKQWTVGDMMRALVKYSKKHNSKKAADRKQVSMDLFDYIRSL